ncbi:hypothetical protein BH10ACI4_BH10ACI4_08520 [soil metagenome]
MTFSPVSALFLFPAMIVLLQIGRRIRTSRADAAAHGAIESAVFALFGLLLAFTFSGAAGRYDEHRKLIVEEANDIGTVYLRLDLLPPASQPALRDLLRTYTEVRAHRFDELPDTPQSIEAAHQTDRLQAEIWARSVAAAPQAGANPDATKLLLPALNTMFDITSTRKNAFNMHPPAIIFLLLFAFSGGCAFMAGYSMSSTTPHWLYTIALALTVTLTVYATLEVEYPRRGLVRLTTQNPVFTDLRNSMN